MAFNTSQSQMGAFNGNRLGNFMSGGFASSIPATYSNTQEDDTYNPRYPGFNKENYEKLERKVAELGLTGSKKQEVMDEFYRQILPQVENEKKKSQRNEVINKKSYDVLQIKDEAERKVANNSLSVEKLAQMVKEKENLREDAPDAAVFNARIKSIPNGNELLANYMNKGDDTLLYKGGLKEETGWQKAGDVAVGVLQSPGKWGYNIMGQWIDRLGKRGAEQLQGTDLQKWVQEKAIELFGEDEVRRYQQEIAKKEAEGTLFNGREATDIRTPLLGEYRANNGWTKGGEIVGDIASGIALTAPIGAALAPTIAGSSVGGAAGIGTLEGLADTAITQYGSQGDLDASASQWVLGGLGGAAGGLLTRYLANLPAKQVKDIKKEAQGYIEKSIRPTVKGKQNQAAYDKFMDDTIDVVDWMSKNKDVLEYTDDAGEVVKGQLPNNLNETRDVIGNMKKLFYNNYNDLAKQAGDAGAKVDLNKVFNQLDDLANDTATNIANPGLKNAIEGYKNQLLQYSDDLGRIEIADAQKLTQQYNKILDAYFKNPGAYANDTSRNIVIAQMNRGVKDAIDESMDDALSAAIKNGSKASEQYRYWKELYGKVKTFEDELSKSALREMRKNSKGLSTQVIDALAGKELVEGLLTQNPTGLVKSITMKGIDAYNKYLNNPNTQLKNLFNLVDKVNNPSGFAAKLANNVGSDTLATIGGVTLPSAEVVGNALTND